MNFIAKMGVEKAVSSALFEKIALETFSHQHQSNPVYRSYCDLLNIDPSEVNELTKIPFLPIDFFKQKAVKSFEEPEACIFTSSGTTGQNPSQHFVRSLDHYEVSFERCFEKFYGPVEDYVILALLPSYLEREGSSLVYMAHRLIEKTKQPQSGFYLDNLEELHQQLLSLEAEGKKTLLLGVSFALLDFAERYPLTLSHTVVMETGGMKGRRKELIRAELHDKLMKGFGVKQIHSEYGMTELMSQAYAAENGLYNCPNWMKVLTREVTDPFRILPPGRNGLLNIIDLANWDSCAFIATDDLGRVHQDGRFEVMGRLDHSAIRGCNLMVY